LTEEDDFVTARPLVEESVGRLRRVGDEHRALQAVRVLAWCYLELGDIERAATHYEDLLSGARAAADKQMEARALATLARFATDEGRHQDALAMLDEAYRLDLGFGDPSEIAMDLIWFARALAFAGREGTAAVLLARAEAMREALGMTYPTWVATWKAEAVSRTRAGLTEVEFANAWEAGEALTADEAVALALHAD
jgi:tetratricopeptide (TPR) repeat protein